MSDSDVVIGAWAVSEGLESVTVAESPSPLSLVSRAQDIVVSVSPVATIKPTPIAGPLKVRLI
jgi:hypothetical protein